MSSTDLNRYGGLERLLGRYESGASLHSFTAQEAAQLSQRLMESPAYRDPKNAHHERVSLDVRSLIERHNPGTIGPSGEVTNGAPAASNDRGSLFR